MSRSKTAIFKYSYQVSLIILLVLFQATLACSTSDQNVSDVDQKLPRQITGEIANIQVFMMIKK